MKKHFLFACLFICLATCCTAQISIYVRLTAYDGRVLTTGGAYEASTVVNGNSIETKSNQFLKVSTYSSDVAQTLNIGSQSTGAGAGKLSMNPMSITKTMDAMTPILFQNCASGTPFKTVEVFFVNGESTVTSKQTYKLVAVKTVAWQTCSQGCSTINETVTFEYGGQIITINKGSDGKGGQIQGGWNRVRNVADDDPATTIK